MSNHYVYVIVNKINLKLYFGSHSWKGEGADPNYYGSGRIIKQAVRKYGKDNFIVYPIKFYDTAEECRKAEEELLTRYDIANNQYCYNLTNSATGWGAGEKHPQYGKRGKASHNYGRHHTEKTKQKISQAQNKIPVVAIDKNGNVKIFNSQAECSRQLNLDYRNVSQCLKGKHKTCKGYFIKHLKRCSTDYKITVRKAKETEKIELTAKRKGTTPVIAIQKDTGRVRMFLSQMECARQLNLDHRKIQRCLKGIRKHTGGYAFKKINRDKRVFTVSPRSKAAIKCTL